ncbi:MAG: hypothetical protein IT167_24190 [Bryobacterales bacterium]|nr:hypothetical protein [Bryobacterales bacterium]MCZ2146757.1 hypothetical protein [Bryobacterales bacterium]
MNTLSARCLKGFADGFGGGVLGGLAYWMIAGLLGAGGLPFPTVKVAAIAVGFGIFESWRVSRKFFPLEARPR